MTAGLNFTLTTDEGDLDLLGEMTGEAPTSNCSLEPFASRCMAERVIA